MTILRTSASIRRANRISETYGVAATKANRAAVLSQFTSLSDTSKYSADVVEIAEKVNHLHRSILVQTAYPAQGAIVALFG